MDIAGLSPRKPDFSPRLLHNGFVVNKVALGQDFLHVPQYYPLRTIPSLLHAHSLSDYVCELGENQCTESRAVLVDIKEF
jgi:hypothetical protein